MKMTKHKHYNMIVAKAANMELVQLVKSCDNGGWYEKGDHTACQWWEDSEYFLCLPQHKEVVLHALNSGEIQYEGDTDWAECVVCYDMSNVKWHNDWWYMDKHTRTRIKPKKEKRWLMAQPISGQTTNHFSSPERAMDSVSNADSRWQLMEIEVEV